MKYGVIQVVGNSIEKGFETANGDKSMWQESKDRQRRLMDHMLKFSFIGKRNMN